MTSMTADSEDRRLPLLIGLLVATFAVAALGSLSTIGNVDGWYADAEKPWFTPPNSVFGPAWGFLYLTMAVAAWLAARAGASLHLWWAQLAVNLVWTPVFFALAWLWVGVAVIVVLDVLVAITTVVFWRRSVAAGLLMTPYLAWILFASALNLGVAILN